MTVTDAATGPTATRGRPWASEALHRADPQLADLLAAEAERRAETIQLLAGENLTTPAVLAALTGPLIDKYAEGYPGRRHHTGCSLADAAELLAIDRARELFAAPHANVQPRSVTSAMLAAYAAVLRPGDGVLAMSLEHGGHLSCGSRANFSGRWFAFTGYGVREADGLIDLDQVRELARLHRPKAIVAGSISYPRHPDWAAFREIADEVDAYLIASAAQTTGLVAAGVAPSPVPYADVTVAATHKLLRGPRGGLLLCTAELAERIDRAVFPFSQGGAAMNEVAGKAVALAEASTPAYRAYAQRTVSGAQVLAEGLAEAGMRPLTGGTDTHLVTADVSPLGVSGAEAERRCAAAGLLLGKCALPYDPAPPSEASGIRLGTGTVTSQGMGAAELSEIAGLIARVLDGGAVAPAAARVRELAQAFADRA
ncbi:glycine hydroxymethyltransferase [Streptomyces sp. 1114.5]|uniref:serine hydroxymethyltransferase n=1 Tax=unclassified Streptomyces TaxID=2593676 RepID=UPI000BC8B0E2|nr:MULTISPECIES: serine hydroxymethyltransferase [unclassified Streptomyces]RKT15899.1 glycine hydroxymethyltransferase [Streptomyces sp. 1114.5]SOB82073.1 glycine hydroxymethyltransferase [Streptomyces sp. 1331.2]